MGLGKAGQGSARANQPALLISANSFWNIVNFRGRLIEALTRNGYRVIIAAPDIDADWGTRREVELVNIAVDRSGLNPIRDAVLLLTYYKLIRRLRPKFYLGYTAKPNIYGSLAASHRGVPALPNVSGLGTAFMKPGALSTFVGTLYQIAFRKCPVVFFQNPDDREMFVSRKIVRPEQARLLPGSGVDLDRFAPAPVPGGVRFLFVGRLLGDKGVREFVAAARMLRAGHPDWKFQLLGSLDEGNRTAVSRSELDQWVAEGAVEYLGSVEDVRPHVGAATAVVLPSYREGLPRSLLEAAAMARPLIATDVPGCRQVVNHGENGLLCAVQDPDSLAQAMERIATMNEGERTAMGQAGRALAEREFGEDQVIEAYLEALTQLRSSRGS